MKIKTHLVVILSSVIGVFVANWICFGESVPSSARSRFDKSDIVTVRFVADSREAGLDESFPHFASDPVVDDYIQGFSGQWYVVRRRTFDWVDKPGRSPDRFTIWIDRADPPPKTAEGDCK